MPTKYPIKKFNFAGYVPVSPKTFREAVTIKNKLAKNDPFDRFEINYVPPKRR